MAMIDYGSVVKKKWENNSSKNVYGYERICRF